MSNFMMNREANSELEEIAEEMRCLSKIKRRTTVLGREFLLDPEVFNPDSSLDITEFMNKEVLKVIEEEIASRSDAVWFDFLEVGCGAGYTAILVALLSQNCRVWATDINEAAVRNTRENAKLHGVQEHVQTVVADVFDHAELYGRKFDMMYWNIPWAGQWNKPGSEIKPLMKALIDPGYQAFRRYLSHARDFLKPTGRVFVVFSFSFGFEEVFTRIVSETGWRFEICSCDNFLVEIADVQRQLDVKVIELFNQEG